MNFKLFYNPFFIIAGWRSFLSGLLAMVLTIYIAYKSGTHFYGLLNIDFAKDSELWIYSVENFSSWIFITILFYLSGLILSKSKIRIIDVMGTTAFSRIPLMITPILRLLPAFRSFTFNSAVMYLIIGIYIISLIYIIVLLYNALKISCNLKNEKLVISFIISLIISEVLTKSFIYFIT